MGDVELALCAVLTGMTFPARKWQLLAQADFYGADFDTRAWLTRLPEGRYPDLATVIFMVTTARAAIPPPTNTIIIDPRPHDCIGLG